MTPNCAHCSPAVLLNGDSLIHLHFHNGQHVLKGLTNPSAAHLKKPRTLRYLKDVCNSRVEM